MLVSKIDDSTRDGLQDVQAGSSLVTASTSASDSEALSGPIQQLDPNRPTLKANLILKLRKMILLGANTYSVDLP